MHIQLKETVRWLEVRLGTCIDTARTEELHRKDLERGASVCASILAGIPPLGRADRRLLDIIYAAVRTRRVSLRRLKPAQAGNGDGMGHHTSFVSCDPALPTPESFPAAVPDPDAVGVGRDGLDNDCEYDITPSSSGSSAPSDRCRLQPQDTACRN